MSVLFHMKFETDPIDVSLVQNVTVSIDPEPVIVPAGQSPLQVPFRHNCVAKTELVDPVTFNDPFISSSVVG